MAKGFLINGRLGRLRHRILPRIKPWIIGVGRKLTIVGTSGSFIDGSRRVARGISRRCGCIRLRRWCRNGGACGGCRNCRCPITLVHIRLIVRASLIGLLRRRTGRRFISVIGIIANRRNILSWYRRRRRRFILRSCRPRIIRRVVITECLICISLCRRKRWENRNGSR